MPFQWDQLESYVPGMQGRPKEGEKSFENGQMVTVLQEADASARNLMFRVKRGARGVVRGWDAGFYKLEITAGDLILLQHKAHFRKPNKRGFTDFSHYAWVENTDRSNIKEKTYTLRVHMNKLELVD